MFLILLLVLLPFPFALASKNGEKKYEGILRRMRYIKEDYLDKSPYPRRFDELNRFFTEEPFTGCQILSDPDFIKAIIPAFKSDEFKEKQLKLVKPHEGKNVSYSIGKYFNKPSTYTEKESLDGILQDFLDATSLFSVTEEQKAHAMMATSAEYCLFQIEILRDQLRKLEDSGIKKYEELRKICDRTLTNPPPTSQPDGMTLATKITIGVVSVIGVLIIGFIIVFIVKSKK